MIVAKYCNKLFNSLLEIMETVTIAGRIEPKSFSLRTITHHHNHFYEKNINFNSSIFTVDSEFDRLLVLIDLRSGERM